MDPPRLASSPGRTAQDSAFLGQWLMLAAALLTLGGSLAWNLYRERLDLAASERERLATQAKVIDDNLSYQLIATNLALDSIRADLPGLRAQDRYRTLLNRRLQQLGEAMPAVLTLLILDADGRAIASSREQLVGRKLPQRDYARAARASANPNTLLLTPPFRDALGVYTINLVKPIKDDAGRYAGVIVAALDPQFLNTLLDSFSYAPDMRSALAHGDGRLFLMRPPRPGNEGIDLAVPGSFFSRHRDSGLTATLLTGIGYATGEERMVAQRSIKPAKLAMDKPLLLSVSRTIAGIFAHWRVQVYADTAFFTLLAMVSAFGLLAYQRRQAHIAHAVSLHQAEQERSAERYQRLIQASFDGFWATDFDGRFLDVNPAICRMLGYSREQLLAMAVQDLEAKASAAETAARLAQLMETGQARFDSQLRRQDGKTLEVEVSAQYVAQFGELFFAFIHDVTEQKRAQAGLRAALAFSHNLLASMQDGLSVLDASGVHIEVNPALCQMTGFSREELLGRGPPHPYWPPEEQQQIEVALDRTLRGATEDLESNFMRRSGERFPVIVSQSTVKDGQGQTLGLLTTVKDISERKRSEQQLAAAKAAAESADQAKSRFLASASHDLRQPLAALSLYVNILKKRPATDGGKLVTSIQNCVDNLSELLTDLLDVSKLDAGVVKPRVEAFAIAQLFNTLASIHAAEAEAKGLRLRLRTCRFIARTDPRLLQRLLGNLVANAIRYTDAGGLLIACRRHDGRHWAEVWDSGVGIAAHQTNIIFEEFRQLADEARGSGLGLAIVAKIAALLGLELRVHSRPGRGSMFAIELPPGQPASEQAPADALAPDIAWRSLRIALVEDNAMVIEALILALEGAGHEVIEATSGPSLFERLGEDVPDILIADYRLAGIETGFDVIEAARNRYGRRLPAILITGDTDPILVRTMADRGIAVYYKPLQFEALLAFIREATERRI